MTDADGCLRIAIEEVVGNELAAARDDADAVAGNAVELYRTVEVDAGDIAFDQVRVIEVAADEQAAAANAGGVVEDVLVLHAAAELHADAVGEDRAGAGAADEAERTGRGHGAAHTRGVVVDAVVAQVGDRVISDADGGAVKIIVLDRAAEHRLDVEDRASGGDVVAADGPAGRCGEADARAAPAHGIVAHLDVSGPGDGDAAAASGDDVVLQRRVAGAARQGDARARGDDAVVNHPCPDAAVQRDSRSADRVVRERHAHAALHRDAAGQCQVL